VHLVTELRVSRRAQAVLWLGAAGVLAASFDGRWLGVSDRLAAAEMDQLAVPLDLTPGPHLLAVTLVPDRPVRMDLYARLTDPEGRPLVGLEALLPQGRTAWGASDPDPPGPLGQAPLAAAPSPTSLEGRLLLGCALRALGLGDAGGPEPILLEEVLAEEDAHALPLPHYLLALGHVPLEERRSSLLLATATRRQAEGDSRLAVLARAELAAERGQRVRADELLASLPPALGPADPAQRLVRARVAKLGGSPERAWRILSEPASDHPGVEAREELAQASLDIGRPDLAVAHYQALVAEVPGDPRLRALLAHALGSAGRAPEALVVLESLVRVHPHLPGYALEAAELAVTLGHADRARESLSAALVPGLADPDLLERAGRLAEHIRDADLAIDLYQRALRLSSGNPGVRAALERLAPAHQEALPFTIRWSPALLARPLLAPDKDFEVLAEEKHIRVREDGGSSRFEHRLIRVTRVPEARDDRTTRLRFDPTQEDARVLEAVVHRGELTIPVLERDLNQVSDSWYGLYYDVRELAVPFDGLRAGDVIEIALRVDTIGAPLIRGAVSLIEVPQEYLPVHELLVSVRAPAGIALSSRLDLGPVPAGRLEERQRVLEDGSRVLELRGEGLPALRAERAMPGAVEHSATWQITSFPSWKRAVDAYAGLLASQVVVTPAMRRWVDAAVTAARGGDGSLDKRWVARRVAEGVAREIRYVGLEFGVHGYQPYRTDQVWSRRFGDCKDQSTLVVTLLHLAGIEARVALVRTRPQGRLSNPLPALGLFDHAVVWLVEAQVFFDPTVRTLGLGDLPAADQGAQALIIDPETDALRPVDTQSPRDSGMQGTYTLYLRPDGSAALAGTTTWVGSHAGTYRERLGEEETRQERIEQMFNNRYPGARLERFEVSDPLRLDQPLTLTLAAELPQAASASQTHLEVNSPAGGHGLAQEWARESARSLPLLLGPPATYRFEMKYVAPAHHTVATVPANAAGAGPFGRYEVVWQAAGQEARVTTEIALYRDQIAAGEYPAFKRFVDAFDAAVRPPLAFLKEGGTRPEVHP
jgi:tetratricopeptide (TPR) repeat protein